MIFLYGLHRHSPGVDNENLDFVHPWKNTGFMIYFVSLENQLLF